MNTPIIFTCPLIGLLEFIFGRCCVEFNTQLILFLYYKILWYLSLTNLILFNLYTLVLISENLDMYSGAVTRVLCTTLLIIIGSILDETVYKVYGQKPPTVDEKPNVQLGSMLQLTLSVPSWRETNITFSEFVSNFLQTNLILHPGVPFPGPARLLENKLIQCFCRFTLV